jgi:hypothetical protein
VRSGCEFWNNSAELLVHGLSVDNIRQHPLTPKDRRGAIVAAAFDREYKGFTAGHGTKLGP